MILVIPRKISDLLIQGSFLAVLVFVIGGFVLTAQANMATQGLTAGFSFLWHATGWNMGFTTLPYSIRDPYWWTLLIGFLNTVMVGLIAMAFATVIGIGLAAMRISGDAVLNAIALIYVDIVRNVPPILQVLAWYAVFSSLPSPRQSFQIGDAVFLSARGLYMPAVNVSGWGAAAVLVVALVAIGVLLWIGFSRRFTFTRIGSKLTYALVAIAASAVICALVFAFSRVPDTALISYPALQGFNFRGGLHLPPELATILVATTVYGSAYIAEVVRGGFLSVDAGKIEAGRAMGLSNWLVFSRIHMPLTIRNVMPMMTNLYVWLIKATTLGIAVGFSDLFMVVVSSINQSGQTMELILILAAGFWLLNGVLVWTMNRVSARLQLKH